MAPALPAPTREHPMPRVQSSVATYSDPELLEIRGNSIHSHCYPHHGVQRENEPLTAHTRAPPSTLWAPRSSSSKSSLYPFSTAAYPFLPLQLFF